jgi:SAM-dependent methyltransferase
MNTLVGDGERFLPGTMTGETALEHEHRYLFARQLVAGRVVLDIACGEGYGSALLARDAAEVIGVDIDAGVIEHARHKYAAVPVSGKLRFEVGDCAAIPLVDACVDLVVSFETIEHHAQHDQMLAEIRRVLRPGGLLLISTPDRVEYSEIPGLSNPFHVKELDEPEFRALLSRHFGSVRCWRQRVVAGSWLLPEGEAGPLQFFDADQPAQSQSVLPHAPYLVALAGNGDLPPVRSGLLAQQVAHLASPMLAEPYRQINEMVRALAVPGSAVLRRHLDAPWYRAHNPDLVAPDFDRYGHWLGTGAKECRQVSPDLPRLVRELVGERLEALSAAALAADVAAAPGVDLQAPLERIELALATAAESGRGLGAKLDNLLAQGAHQLDAWRDEAGARVHEWLSPLTAAVAALDEAAKAQLGAIGRQQVDAARTAAAAIEENGRRLLDRMDQLERALADAHGELSATRARHEQELAHERRRHEELQTALRHQAAAAESRHVERESATAALIEELRRGHDETVGQLRQHHADALASAQSQLERQSRAERELSENYRQLAQSLERMTTAAARAADERVALAGELHVRDQQVATLLQQMSTLRASRSWRWTAPLRRLFRSSRDGAEAGTAPGGRG